MIDSSGFASSQEFKRLDDVWVFRAVLMSKARLIRSYLSTATTLHELLHIAGYDWDSFRKGESAYDENAVQIAHHPDFLDSSTQEAACFLATFDKWRNFADAFAQWYGELLPINDVARRVGLAGREPVLWRMSFYGNESGKYGVLVQSGVKPPHRSEYPLRTYIALPEDLTPPLYPVRRMGDHFEWLKRELTDAAARFDQWVLAAEDKIDHDSAALGWPLAANSHDADKQVKPGMSPADARDALPAPDDLVRLEQAAAFVHRPKRALETHLAQLPKPYFQGGAGKPSLWKWSELRHWLEENFLPEVQEPAPAITPTLSPPPAASVPVTETRAA